MIKKFAVLALLLCLSGCVASQLLSGPGPDPEIAQTPIQNEVDETVLEGRAFSGKIRARGIVGLISVAGQLSFQNGSLIWDVEGAKDVGPYQLVERDGNIAFTAVHELDNGESVLWAGIWNGEEITNVTAQWTRVEGDFLHDLLLPDQVMLDFKVHE